MTKPAPLLQYTTVRGIIKADGQQLIGIKHTAKGADGAEVKHDWIDMPPDTVRGLIKTLQETLDDLGDKLAGGDEVRNG